MCQSGDAATLASRQLTLLRLYTLAAEGQSWKGQVLYPTALTVPESTRQTFVQVAGDGWDFRIQRIRLDRYPGKCLHASGLGFDLDLYLTAQRVRAEKAEIAERTE
jgi:hypothetical protein